MLQFVDTKGQNVKKLKEFVCLCHILFAVYDSIKDTLSLWCTCSPNLMVPIPIEPHMVSFCSRFCAMQIQSDFSSMIFTKWFLDIPADPYLHIVLKSSWQNCHDEKESLWVFSTDVSTWFWQQSQNHVTTFRNGYRPNESMMRHLRTKAPTKYEESSGWYISELQWEMLL